MVKAIDLAGAVAGAEGFKKIGPCEQARPAKHTQLGNGAGHVFDHPKEFVVAQDTRQVAAADEGGIAGQHITQ